MPGCAVYGCGNYSRKTKGTDVKYYGFPQNEELSKQWVNACGRQDKFKIQQARVCSKHFHPLAFVINLKHKLLNYCPKTHRDLQPDAVPTELLFKKPASSKLTSDRNQRSHLREETKNRKMIISGILQYTEPSTEPELMEEEKENITIIPDHLIEVQSHSFTEPSVLDTTRQFEEMRLELEKFKFENENLRKANASLNQDLLSANDELKSLKTILEKHFGPGQIRRLLDPTKNKRWTPEDIASAISLRSVSPKAYRFLRKIGHPLPALSTLRKWALNLNLDQGILKDVVKLMEKKSLSLTALERVCVICFDEIYISNKICLDPKDEKVLGPHKSCQVAIVRGLFSPWKQPIFYMFDTPMSKNIVFEIIQHLHSANYDVVAMTNDMGPGNQKLWTELNIGHDKNCFFHHPLNKHQKVFAFADVPHLLKLVRNHFIDQGFKINENVISKSCIEEIIAASSEDLKIAHKISQYHLALRGTERQKVKPAAQIFSNTLSKAIEWCGMQGFLKSTSWKETAKFLKMINDWFDIFNAKCKYGSHPGTNAFGTDLENQISALNQTSDIISKMIVGKHKSLIHFQKDILLSNISLITLHDYLHQKYDIDNLITYRINQDVVENFFSYIRGMGAQNDHPDPLEIKYRLRWYILGKHSMAVFTMNKNTEEGDEFCLLKPLKDDETCLSQQLLDNTLKSMDPYKQCDFDADDEPFTTYSFVQPEITDDVIPEVDLSNLNLTTEQENVLLTLEANKFSDIIASEGLKYIAGYVAYRFRNKFQYLNLANPTKKLFSSSNCNPDWTEFLSRGYLLHPSDELIQLARIVEEQFIHFHNNFLSKEPKVFKKLTDIVIQKLPFTLKCFPYEIIICMVRTRTYIRLRELNKKISFLNCKRRLEKKMSKFTNKKINSVLVFNFI